MSELIGSWRELLDRYESFKTGQWCLRGDCCRGEGFKTSLERAAVDRWGRDWSELPEIEEGLLRRFKREVHLYLSNEPEEGDLIGGHACRRSHGINYSGRTLIIYTVRGWLSCVWRWVKHVLGVILQISALSAGNKGFTEAVWSGCAGSKL